MTRAFVLAIAFGCAGPGSTTPPRATASATSMAIAPPATSTSTSTSTTFANAPIISDVPPRALACVARLYEGVARRDGSAWSLVLRDGQVIPYDDGKTKTLYERFESPDVEDLFELEYRKGRITPVTQIDFDPGRIRIDAIFFATYGKTAKEAEASLVSVRVGGKWFAVHKKIEAPLRRVATRIDEAMKHDPSLARFFESPGGTFNWRRIAGSDQLSMHAWAIAIDLDTPHSNYWRNEPRDQSLTWKNAYPQAIVDAFEAEGFAWGGRWYHYDTMHFEYRPELLDPACYPATK